MELQDLREQLTALESERERIYQSGLDTSFQDATIREVKAHIADLESQQNLQERVEQAKETGYYFDTLTTSNGVTMAELSYSPEYHELQAIAVQKGFLAKEDAFNTKLADMQETINHLEGVEHSLEAKLYEIEKELHQANMEKLDAESKRDNAMNQLRDQEEMNSRQRATIESLKAQIAGESVPLAPLSAEERETKLLAELNGNRIKVTNVRLKDINGFDTRISLANNALTGDEIEFHTIYIKRYEEISQEAAEQLRTEYANKKAEIEALTAIIPVQEPESIEYVREQDEAAAEEPFQANQVDATTVGLATESPSDEGQVVESESEVITLESLKAEVDAIKSHLGLVA